MASKARDIADLGSNDVLETTSTGVEVTGDVSLGDNGKAKFGAGDDLQIYHDGSNSYVKDTGTGDLYLQGSSAVQIEDASGTNMIYALSGDTVQLFHNGSNKLATTSTGVDVTGTVTADGLTIDGESTVDSVAYTANSTFPTTGVTLNANGFSYEMTGSQGKIFRSENNTKALMQIGINGDVQFYEDTGTTAKMVWDASAESLSVPDLQLSLSDTNSTGTIGRTDRVYIEMKREDFDGSINFYTTTNGSSGVANRMTISDTGNVGIGTGSPNRPLTVRSGGTTMLAEFKNASNTQSYISFANSTSSADQVRLGSNGSNLVLSTNYTERARIDSSGNLLVGRTSQLGANSKLTLECNATTDDGLTINDSYSGAGAANSVNFYRNSIKVGSITNTTSAVSYNTSSDRRLKENIQDTTHTVDINDIQVREFDWKADGSHQRYGFIAQELETIYPEAVHSPEDADEMKAVDYSKLVPLLVKEIQTLKAEIKELKA